MSYELGQIIYVLSEKTQTIVPAVIEEEFHHKKLNGNVVKYTVAIGPPNKKKIIDLERVDGEVFTSLDEIRTTLTERSIAYINSLIQTTEERMQKWYGEKQESLSEQKSPNTETNKIDPKTFLDSADSVVTNKSVVKSSPPSTPQQALHDHLRKMVSSSEEEDQMEQQIIDADGTVRKVKVNIPI